MEKKNRNVKLVLGLALLCLVAIWASRAMAQMPLPRVEIGVEPAREPKDIALTLQILFLLTILSLAPAILIMTTAFIRIVVVLAFIRQSLGTQQLPPNQVIIGLALFLTLFVMMPTFNQVWRGALKPYLDKKITLKQAYDKGIQPIRAFMFSQTRHKDIALFVHLSGLKKPKTRADVPTYALIPAFMISELKIAFQIGFVLFVPFLIIDMVVASTLMSMGMMMLPPIMISLPFKILLFVMVDGWHLISRSLVLSFQ